MSIQTYFYLLLASIFFSVHGQIPETTSYPLGKASSSWGAVIYDSAGETDLKVKVGARLQAMNEHRDDKKQNSSTDLYLRRLRLMLQTEVADKFLFYMDMRDDKIEQNESGEKEFSVGDAYVFVPKLFGQDWLNLKAFRAKVDVSRQQTVSSSAILFLNRAHISDEAAQYVSHNRRAVNYQFIGDFDSKLSYQLVVGEGVAADKFHDALGASVEKIIQQGLMTGARLRFSPFSGWEEGKLTETYFGQGQHFSISAGFFQTPNIVYSSSRDSVDRSLFNANLSFHYKNFFFTTETYHFHNVIRDFSAAEIQFGKSSGQHYQLEYVFPQYSYLAPFLRYEYWNRFEEDNEFLQKTRLVGLNWYLRANQVRLGAFYSEDDFGRALQMASKSDAQESTIGLTAMFNF